MLRICSALLVISTSLAWSSAAAPLAIPDDLGGWVASGDVAAAGGVATLTDLGGPLAHLYQGVAVTPGTTRLAFDIRVDTSPDVASFGFLDTVFASVVFADDLAGFALGPGAGVGAQLLLSADSNGIRPATGALSPSGLGADWQTYTATFDAPAAYVIPVFELFGQNGIAGDSLVEIANVVLASATTPPIPEPQSALQFALGAALVSRRRPARSPSRSRE